jgi:hypothetical protein
MEAITRSRYATASLIAAAGLYALGALLALLAWAMYSATPFLAAFIRFEDWYRASDWLAFAAFVAALGAVGHATWQVLRSPGRRAEEVAETASAFAGTLLLVIAAFESAQVRASPLLGGQPATPFVLMAIGFALWTIPPLSLARRTYRAGRTRDDTTSRSNVRLSLLVAASLALLAVAQGILAAKDGVLIFGDTLTGRGPVIAGGAIGALCICGVLAALLIAKSRTPRPSRTTTPVCVGLASLAASRLTEATVVGILLAPHASVNAFRVAMSVIKALLVVGFIALALGAWLRIAEMRTDPFDSSDLATN